MIQTNTKTEENIEQSLDLKRLIFEKLIDFGVSEEVAAYLNMLVLLVGLLIIIFLIDIVIRKLLISAFNQFAKRSKTNFDDLLVSNKAPRNIAHIIPLLIAIEFVPDVFTDFYNFEIIVEKILKVFAIVLTLWIARSLLHTVRDYLKTLPRLKDKPIESYIQVFMIFAWLAGVMSAIAIITGIPFLKFLTGLGAISAVIILVFKDTILGFVASIQVSINDMLRIGDWITFEKYGADGDVIEITLATVKVQNWDKTITTIPTYALISDSFKNWRGMTSSGGRRIKRAVNIKQHSIKCLSEADIESLKKIELIRSYLEKRQQDITEFNTSHNINKSMPLNGRNLTNVGVFRKYVQTYIERHSAVNKDMTIMVRQLAPTSQGLPIEIYAFSTDKRWVNYEYIMADIFDHVLAAVPYFGLEIFEYPSSITLNTEK
ncbi:miniconductance mechanosensitive channel [Hyunsoonleella jejuensis]|uniref:Mechanosensing system component YbdG n=1 Tax=Hyunsoonleella jejuensis TaxID=419940 RepID=A0A1H9G2Y7_9FLAO|nr:mechanosensitive ion channel domain-containing protein [Hyunsoonleella jejuensis]SEQ44098.1 miniconductance mechanosensitive channel [Hyunsoonleella jejuensis]